MNDWFGRWNGNWFFRWFYTVPTAGLSIIRAITSMVKWKSKAENLKWRARVW